MNSARVRVNLAVSGVVIVNQFGVWMMIQIRSYGATVCTTTSRSGVKQVELQDTKVMMNGRAKAKVSSLL